MVNLPSRTSRAFTLIELVTVIVILGVLAAIGSFAYVQFTQDTRKNTSVNAINTFAKTYQGALATGRTPAQAYSDADGDTPGVTTTFHNVAPVVRTNLVTNPSVETNKTGFSVYGNGTTEREVRAGGIGSAGLMYTTSSTSTSGMRLGKFTITPGQTYTASFYGGVASATPSRVITPYIEWYNANNYVSNQAGNSVTIVQGAPVRLNVTATAPANVTHAEIQMRVTGHSFPEKYFFDAFLLEESEVLGNYFDGSTANGSAGQVAWTGTAHGSTSTLTLPKTNDLVTIQYNNQTMCYGLPENAGDTRAPKLYTDVGNPPAGSYKNGACVV